MEKADVVLWIEFTIIQCLIILVQPEAETPKAKKEKRTTQSFSDYVKNVKQQALFFEYYPNYGYEPYWADGEWVLQTSTRKGGAESKTEVTQFVPKACGVECNHLFQRIKHICARASGVVAQAGGACGTGFLAAVVGGLQGEWDRYFGCDGWPGPNYMPGFRTFNTYCEFLAFQCKNKFYAGERWVLVHVGKCEQIDIHFKPLWYSWQPVSRYEFYLSSFSQALTTTTITRTGKGMQHYDNIK